MPVFRLSIDAFSMQIPFFPKIFSIGKFMWRSRILWAYARNRL